MKKRKRLGIEYHDSINLFGKVFIKGYSGALYSTDRIEHLPRNEWFIARLVDLNE